MDNGCPLEICNFSFLQSGRNGLLFTWNFSAEPWLYVALNDYHARNGQPGLESQYRIGAIKAKYLLYF